MAFGSQLPLSANELIDLKAKVKAEMARRNQSGSLADYATTEWDYSTNPASGEPLRVEHQNKIIEPMRALNDIGMPKPLSAQDGLVDMAYSELKVDVASVRGITDRSASDCRSGCTGTCFSTCASGCYTGCTSCSGCTGCSGCSSCSGSCSGGCSSSCKGSCSGCGGTCKGMCSGCGGCGSNRCSGGCSAVMN